MLRGATDIPKHRVSLGRLLESCSLLSEFLREFEHRLQAIHPARLFELQMLTFVNDDVASSPLAKKARQPSIA